MKEAEESTINGKVSYIHGPEEFNIVKISLPPNVICVYYYNSQH